MEDFCVSIDKTGRVLIPAVLRKKLGLEPGTSLTLREEDGELRFISRLAAIRRAQEYFQKHMPEHLKNTAPDSAAMIRELRDEDERLFEEKMKRCFPDWSSGEHG